MTGERPLIYWDHNATTPLRAEVAELLGQAAHTALARPGNPSSVHRAGREARARLDRARASVARLLGCEPREVCFTASGSEADALAIRGVFGARADLARRRIVTSSIEHPAVLIALAQLEAEGAEVVRVAPEASGRIPAKAMIEALTPHTLLCSLMWANNETGVLQPVAEVARACRERGVLFHSDAVNAAGKVPVGLPEAAVDLLSISAHKLGGPAGVGALIIRRGVPVQALVPGHQEEGRRGGTHNLPYIEALALALELSAGELERSMKQAAELRDRFEAAVREQIPQMVVNGTGAPRLPNTSNLRFPGADGEALLIALDLEGICVSAGAACASGSLRPSHVLTAMGLSPAEAQESLRFSLGPTSTEEELQQVLAALVAHLPRAREASKLGA